MYEEDKKSLTDEEFYAIQDEYRQQRLLESLVGPVGSTLFHIILIIILALFIKDKYEAEDKELKITAKTIEEVVVETKIIEEVPEPEPISPDVSVDSISPIDIELEKEEQSPVDEVTNEVPNAVDSEISESFTDVIQAPSVYHSQPISAIRSPEGRKKLVKENGGTPDGQVRLGNALAWLQKVQNANGSWGQTNHQAYTGLALLTFLAHGETASSKKFGVTVRKAMEWLAFSPDNVKASHGYPHAIRAYALAEAYAMTGVSLLEDAMNQSIRTIIKGMQQNGCYDYNYKMTSRQDLSFAGWNYQALKAAYGAGCEEPGLTEAIMKGVKWLKDRGASSDVGKGFPYALKDGVGGGGKATMRAVGVLCLQLYGEGKASEIADEVQVIAELDYANLSWANPPKESLYGWYYATQAMFQHGGNYWKKWNKRFQKELNDNQHPEGYWDYPGDCHGPKEGSLDRKIYGTALCSLMQTVYYRYLPSSKGAIGARSTKSHQNKVEIDALNLIE